MSGSMMTLGLAAELMGARLSGGRAETGVTGVSTDSRTLTAGQLFFALGGPNFDGHEHVAAAAQAGACAAVVAREVDAGLPQLRVDDVLAALQACAGGWRRRFELPLIGITGSNGKTTVEQLLTAILGRAGDVLATIGNLNNHIGVPLTLSRLAANHRHAVVEMGANHAGEIRALARIAAPTHGLVTNAGDAHLEGFGDRAGVAQAKGELFAELGDRGTAIINADDAYASLWLRLAGNARIVRFGRAENADVRLIAARPTPGEAAQRVELRIGGSERVVALPLPGEHNARNAAAAAAAAFSLGLPEQLIVDGLEAAVGAGGRSAVQRIGGIRLIDDAYNANPDSVRAAIDLLAGYGPRRWLVLGDMAELGADAERLHAELGEYARERGIEHLLACGGLVAGTARRFGAGGEALDTPTAAVDRLVGQLREGDTVLVKGSRSARMERVVEALRRALDEPGERHDAV